MRESEENLAKMELSKEKPAKEELYKEGEIKAESEGLSDEQKEQFEKYVKSVTPTHNLWLQMLKAFVCGGAICTFGQLLSNYFTKTVGLDKEMSASACVLTLILISTVLTGLNLYPKLSKFAGAGALVPITGFANSVTAPAIEYRSEGHVFGIGCKIFTIAGPVILFGIFASFILGILYYLMPLLGIHF